MCALLRPLADLSVEYSCACGQWEMTHRELTLVSTMNLSNHVALSYIDHLLSVIREQRKEIDENRT